MFTLWDIKYKDDISRLGSYVFEYLDKGFPSVYADAVEFRNKMNEISEEFREKFKGVMHEVFGTLDVSVAVPYFLRSNPYGATPCIWFEGIDKDGKETFGEVGTSMVWGYVLDYTEDEKKNNKVIDAMYEDMRRIDDLMEPYWERTNRSISQVGYSCRERYFMKGEKDTKVKVSK